MRICSQYRTSTLSYIESVKKTAPFLKHQFWEEENEYRAAFNLHSSKKPHDDFIDITITEDLIDYIILGPTFSAKEVDAISKIKEVTLDFDLMDKKQSRGTGIIHMN